MRRAVGIVGRGRIACALLDDPSVATAERAGTYIIDTTPDECTEAVGSLQPFLTGEEISVVTAVPGLSLTELRQMVGPGPVLFRAVARAGSEKGGGVIVVCPEQGRATDVPAAVVELLEIAGSVEVVAEEMLGMAAAVVDAAADSVLLAMKGMEEGAVQAGLTRSTAEALVRQTALATAVLLADHPGSPADLKDQVASPGGTTISGLAALEERAVRGAFIKAVLRAAGKEPATRAAGGVTVTE